VKVTELESILRGLATSFDVQGTDQWRIVAHDVAMQIYANPPKDRMRVISLVMGAADLSGDQLRNLLEGNFHCDESDLRNGLRQVAELTKTFGQHHAGGPMRFDWPRPDAVKEGGVRRRNVDAVTDGMRRGGEPPKR
jgi:hypothetical protein